jgi:hypothetical protein
MAITQVLMVNARTASRMLVVHQVRHAGHWITRDAQMAQQVVPGAASGFPLTLTWKDLAYRSHTVIYSIQYGKLRRSHSQNGGATSKTMVAQFIDPAATSANVSGGVLVFRVTAQVREHRETRAHRIMPRPDP